MPKVETGGSFKSYLLPGAALQNAAGGNRRIVQILPTSPAPLSKMPPVETGGLFKSYLLPRRTPSKMPPLESGGCFKSNIHACLPGRGGLIWRACTSISFLT
jgi:hypothetical protein